MCPEERSLNLFHKRLNRLLGTGLAKDISAPDKFRVTIYESGEMGLPDFEEDGRDAFVLNYRLISRDKDGISLACISRLVKSSKPPLKAAALFEEWHYHIASFLNKKEHFQGSVSNSQLIDAFIYGRYAHISPEEEQFLNSREKVHGSEMVRLVLVVVLELLLMKFVSLQRATEAIVADLAEQPRSWEAVN